MAIDITGKRALITGGTKGIGGAVAIDVAKLGADVVINSRHDDDDAKSTLAEIEKTGRRGKLITADVAKGDDCQRLVREAAEFLGGLDILVHSAGGGTWGAIDQVEPDDWHNCFDVHVHAAYYLSRDAVPLLREAGSGAIILISSAAGIRGVPGFVAYATAKGAIVQMTRAMARDLADDDIRVNCVAPGVICTAFHDDMSDEKREHNLKNRIPLHREGTPEDVAEAVRLLVTNSYITGETVVIDAGLTMQIVR